MRHFSSMFVVIIPTENKFNIHGEEKVTYMKKYNYFSHYCWGQECVELYFHSPNTPSWHGIQ